MKKWIGALCSALAGVLTLVFLSVPAFTIDYTLVDEKYSGWKLLTNKTVGDWDCTAVTWYRIFAWVLVVLAVVLIVLAVLQILANLNIIKMPAILTTINKFALIAIAVVSVLALIANFGIRGEFIDAYKDLGAKGDVLKEIKEAHTVGAALWIVTVVNLASCVVAGLLDKAKK